MHKFAHKADVKLAGDPSHIKEDRNKKIKPVRLLVEIIVLVVAFPICAGLVLSALLFRFVRTCSYCITNNMKKFHMTSIQTYKSIYYSILLTIAVCFFILMSFVYKGSMAVIQTDLLPSKSKALGIFTSFDTFFRIVKVGRFTNLFSPGYLTNTLL
jgi:hypothetical protein